LANAEFRGTFIIFLLTLNFATKHFSQKWSGRRGSNSQLSAWEAEFSILYFQHLQNQLEKMCVHALRTVHALPDLRVAGGRLGDGVSLGSSQNNDPNGLVFPLSPRSLQPINVSSNPACFVRYLCPSSNASHLKVKRSHGGPLQRRNLSKR